MAIGEGTEPSAYCFNSCSQRASRSWRSWFGRLRLRAGAGVLGVQVTFAWRYSKSQHTWNQRRQGTWAGGDARITTDGSKHVIHAQDSDDELEKRPMSLVDEMIDREALRWVRRTYLDTVGAWGVAIAFDFSMLT